MPKRTKDQKRKAKLKERRRHIENAFHEQGNQLAHALEVLCEPIRDKYLDPAKISDLEGYKVAYSIGLYAWNICVSGRTGPTRNALRGHINNPDQLATMEKDIGDLIRRKYELYPGIQRRSAMSYQSSGTEPYMQRSASARHFPPYRR